MNYHQILQWEHIDGRKESASIKTMAAAYGFLKTSWIGVAKKTVYRGPCGTRSHQSIGGWWHGAPAPRAPGKKKTVEQRINNNLKSRMAHAIRGRYPLDTREFLGCDIRFILYFLGTKFEPGMTWENYGEWEIDHITPIALYNLRKQSEALKCFHFTNLRPRWKKDNRRVDFVEAAREAVGKPYGAPAQILKIG